MKRRYMMSYHNSTVMDLSFHLPHPVVARGFFKGGANSSGPPRSKDCYNSGIQAKVLSPQEAARCDRTLMHPPRAATDHTLLPSIRTSSESEATSEGEDSQRNDHMVLTV